MDPSTLDLLTLLLDQVPTLRLYLVLTCRPTLQPSWGFRTHLTPLTLTPLTRSHVEAMVQGLLRGHYLPAAVLAQIVAQTDGIPLFVEEVTKAVVEAGLQHCWPGTGCGDRAVAGAGHPRHPARGAHGPAGSTGKRQRRGATGRHHRARVCLRPAAGRGTP